MSSGADRDAIRTARPLPAREAGGMRHLALFLAGLDGGGAERMMVQLAAGIAAAGVKVDLVLARAVGPYLAEVPDAVRIVDLGRGSAAAAVLPLAAYLRRTRPDVLLSTLHHASVAAAIAHRAAAVPTLVFVREANTPSEKPVAWRNLKIRLIRGGMRWVYASSEGVIAVSEGVAEDLRCHFGVADHKVRTLFSPVVTPEAIRKAAIDPGHHWLRPNMAPVVLGVGRLQPHKGFRTLLAAFQRLRFRLDARLIVLGEGPQRAELEAYAVDLGIAEDVEFPGFVANPFAYMRRAGVFVLASDREGLPGVLIQAMACGCPVVATDCRSGPSEILDGGRYGTLVPVGDADAMALAIERTLAEDREAFDVVGRSARFASDRVAAEHIEVFDRAVRAQRARTARGEGRGGRRAP